MKIELDIQLTEIDPKETETQDKRRTAIQSARRHKQWRREENRRNLTASVSTRADTYSLTFRRTQRIVSIKYLSHSGMSPPAGEETIDCRLSVVRLILTRMFSFQFLTAAEQDGRLTDIPGVNYLLLLLLFDSHSWTGLLGSNFLTKSRLSVFV